MTIVLNGNRIAFQCTCTECGATYRHRGIFKNTTNHFCSRKCCTKYWNRRYRADHAVVRS